jgi:hypothetical protein
MAQDDLKRYAWPEAEPPRWANTEVKTVVATRLMPQDAPPAPSEQQIGRDVGNATRELFVSCDATQAMQIQFDHIAPQYLAVDDLGGGLSRHLLQEMSQESGWPLYRLVIRRQGFGTTLATIFYLDCPATNDRFVRLYATDVDADAPTRQALARLLLARSTLAAVLVPEHGPAPLPEALRQLKDEYFKGQWFNRHVIFMPMKATPEMVDAVARFGRETGLAARITPSVQRATQIWVYLGASWNRLQETTKGAQAITFASLALAPPAPPAQSLGFVLGTGAPAAEGVAGASAAPPPAGPAAAPTPNAFDGPAHAPVSEPLPARYVRQIGQWPGVEGACIFDVKTLQSLGHAGPKAQALVWAHQSRAMLTAMAQAGKEMGVGAAISETVVTYAQQRVILRGVPGHPGCVLCVVVERNATPVAHWLAELDRLAAALPR